MKLSSDALLVRKPNITPMGKGNEVDRVRTVILLEQRSSRRSRIRGGFVSIPRDSASSPVVRNHWVSWLWAWYVLLQYSFRLSFAFYRKNKAILMLVGCSSSFQLESCSRWGTLSSACTALQSLGMVTFKQQCVFKGWAELRWVLLQGNFVRGTALCMCLCGCSLPKGLMG